MNGIDAHDDDLTRVELTWVEGRTEYWIRFGQETGAHALDRARRIEAAGHELAVLTDLHAHVAEVLDVGVVSSVALVLGWAGEVEITALSVARQSERKRNRFRSVVSL